MIVSILVAALLQFGGVPFGTTEEALRSRTGITLSEEKLADGSRGVGRDEDVAGHFAHRTWIIRGGKFVEGVLLFNFKGDSNGCHQLENTALSAIQANYGVTPKLLDQTRATGRGLESEMWMTTLADGSRIEERMLFVPLIGACTVSGRYFPKSESSSAF